MAGCEQVVQRLRSELNKSYVASEEFSASSSAERAGAEKPGDKYLDLPHQDAPSPSGLGVRGSSPGSGSRPVAELDRMELQERGGGRLHVDSDVAQEEVKCDKRPAGRGGMKPHVTLNNPLQMGVDWKSMGRSASSRAERDTQTTHGGASASC